ncbi:MAG TPA: phosphate acyltransferase PlsX [Campylobacterales bacterium]|nr:phosphate acyltransferase PlsX [Campylobacterales bacterium]HIP59871.1 phosphate acyltransferase PlsX [Campylobacterales bacterium]
MHTIAVDAMGGDFGPIPIVDGVILSLKKSKQKFNVLLVGKSSEFEHRIPRRFKKYIEIVECDDVFAMSESATDALKRKESTIYKAVELVRDGRAQAVVSAGHSGATMSLATLRIGRIKGVSRPAIATLMPTATEGRTLVLDVGANVDCKPEHLFEFGILGHVYAKSVLKLENPRIGLLSNGEEKSKGTEITKETHALLTAHPSFIGNVEGSDIFNDSVDIVVCDGFVGNILLKTSEGVASSISKLIKLNIKMSPRALTGALLMRRVFKLLKKQIDYAEYGGAPLLGVKNCTIICHGKSNKIAIKNAMYQARDFLETDINQDIENSLLQYR